MISVSAVKSLLIYAAAAVAAWLALVESSQLYAQGSLTPPGAPAATMKSLDQIEPRIPIDATHTPGNGSNTFIVSAAGSYYLTVNVSGISGKNGILITTSNVTVDLSGYTLFGVSGRDPLTYATVISSARSQTRS